LFQKARWRTMRNQGWLSCHDQNLRCAEYLAFLAVAAAYPSSTSAQPFDEAPAAEASAAVEDYPEGNEPLATSEEETDELPTPLALTAVQSWQPTGAILFKSAAVCHRVVGDWYGLAAVFTVYIPWYGSTDQVWYLLVDGLRSRAKITFLTRLPVFGLRSRGLLCSGACGEVKG
jgi:hypothetical protein